MPEERLPGQGCDLESAWFELTLVVNREVEAALSDALLECGAAAVQTEDADAHTAEEEAIFAEPHLPPTGPGVWSRNRLCALLKIAPDLVQSEASRMIEEACALARLQVTPPWELRALVDQDWVRLTQSQFQPIAVGDRLWISPSWHDSCPADRRALILDPGLAFGTGSHPTTRLCLEWLESHLRGGEEVLDYGCGSGILGIAAALLGARRVHAVDIDPQALRATRENALRNQVADLLDVSTGKVTVLDTTARVVGSADAIATEGGAAQRLAGAAGAGADRPRQAVGQPANFDVVIANILAAPLKLLAPLLEARLRPGGWIVLAGLLSEQAEDVSCCYPYTSPAPWRSEEGWTVLAGRRHQAPPAHSTRPTHPTHPARPARPARPASLA
jgi:ribosomal protein L11 methyltransferase